MPQHTPSDRWFTVEAIDADTYAISEYAHWEEPHCYLLNGDRASLLIDTGLGVGQIAAVAAGLAGRPVTGTTWAGCAAFPPLRPTGRSWTG